MKANKTWLFPYYILLISLMALVISGCKKQDKTLEIPVEVKNFYPNSGQSGTLVTIEGVGFMPDIRQYKATIGGLAAEVIGATDKSVVIRMPANGATGALELTVHDHTYQVGQYTYQALSIKRIFPNNGTTGSQIRISGAGFSSVKTPVAVTINNKVAQIVSASDTLIVTEIPANAGSGPVVVKADGREVRGQDFRFQLLTGIKPLTGGANTRITVIGSGFETSLDKNIVEINGQVATVLSATETALIVSAPAKVTSGPLAVIINGQKLTGPDFTVVGKPVITSVTPLSGPQGTLMTISGDIFSNTLEENKVFINNTEVRIQSASKNKLTLMVPGGIGAGAVQVVVNDQMTDGPQFKEQTLGILSLTPDNGLAGTKVSISGIGFSAVPAENMVYFNGVPAAILSATATTLEVAAPAILNTGDVKVTVNRLEALSAMPFRRAGVITVAGGPASNVLSNNLYALAADSHGNIYVSDIDARRVKIIAPNGSVRNLQVNGNDVVFGYPTGILVDKLDNVFVADQGDNRIMKITSGGQQQVYTSGFSPGHLTMDVDGNLYANVLTPNSGMMKINISGNYSRFAGPSWPRSHGVTDFSGNMYYGDEFNDGNNAIKMRTTTGQLPSLAGTSVAGFQDGVGPDARFNNIRSIVLSKPGELMVADGNNNAIRIVEISTGKVSTLSVFQSGYADGDFREARFTSLTDMTIGKDGTLYVLDAANKAVRKILIR